jgi:predicted metal-dependent HD superfamily phosphohydrolase
LGSDSGPGYAKHWRWLPVYVAQLSNDTDALARYASDPERYSWALQAMSRMGRSDVLKVFAADPKYAYREVAENLLNGK